LDISARSLVASCSAALSLRCTAAWFLPVRADEVTVTSALTSQLLGELVDTDRQPLLIHCVDGRLLRIFMQLRTS